jgi:hypothetical protein
MSVHFDFNEYFIQKEENRILLQLINDVKVLQQINTIIKNKQQCNKKNLLKLITKHKFSLEFYKIQYKINKTLL